MSGADRLILVSLEPLMLIMWRYCTTPPLVPFSKMPPT